MFKITNSNQCKPDFNEIRAQKEPFNFFLLFVHAGKTVFRAKDSEYLLP